MKLRELLDELASRGVGLVADGDRLAVRAQEGVLDEALVAAIRDHKSDLLGLLRESEPSGGAGAALHPREDSGEVIASAGQRRFWELHRLAPEPTVLNVPGAFRLKGPLDVDALAAALRAFVQRHDILRSRFRDGPDGPRIEIEPEVLVELPVEDLSHVEEGEREAAMRQTLEARSDEPLDLEHGPPFAARLLRLGNEDHALLFVPHSLVWDGWSFDILLRELAAHYEDHVGWQGSAAVTELPVQYADFADWQQRRLSSGVLDECMEYWTTRMAGPVPSLNLPTTPRETASTGYGGARQWFELDAGVLSQIRALARAERTTPYAVLLAAFNALLHRYSGVRDVLVASPLYGRDRPELEALVGVFANTLFLRTAVEPELTFLELVRRTRTSTAEAVEHQAAPTEQVAALLREGSGSRSPYEALFVFQQTAKRPASFGPLEVRSIRRGTRRVAVDLTVWVREYDDYIDGAFDFRIGLFEPATIQAMMRHFQLLVRDATLRPETPVSDLELADAEERRQVAGWTEDRMDALVRAAGPRNPEDPPTRAALLDARGRPTAVNVLGEIHLDGMSTASGWVGTGVSARWTAQGDLQVEATPGGGPGPRPGLNDLTARLEGHPDVVEATTAMQPAGADSWRIVAYVVWEAVDPPFDSEVRRYVGDTLPAELVPAVIVPLDELPRDGMGRVSMADLPNPFGAAPDASDPGVATETERIVAEIWTELLGVDQVRAEDNFFELGGHSLLAVEAVSRLERHFGTRVVARDTFFLSLRQIAAGIDAAGATTDA